MPLPTGATYIPDAGSLTLNYSMSLAGSLPYNQKFIPMDIAGGPVDMSALTSAFLKVDNMQAPPRRLNNNNLPLNVYLADATGCVLIFPTTTGSDFAAMGYATGGYTIVGSDGTNQMDIASGSIALRFSA